MSSPQPIDSLRFVHEAILHESQRLDDAVAAELDAAAASRLADEFTVFAELVHAHTSGEEIGLFPALVEREAHVAETYLHDHEDERRRFATVIALLRRLAEGDATVIPSLRREVTALRTQAVAHVEKENRYVLPWVAQSFDVPAQAAIVQKILSTIAPESMPKIVPWIVARLGDDTACAYVGLLARVMPPPVFATACGWIAAGCSAARVAVLRERAPGFAG